MNDLVNFVFLQTKFGYHIIMVEGKKQSTIHITFLLGIFIYIFFFIYILPDCLSKCQRMAITSMHYLSDDFGGRFWCYCIDHFPFFAKLLYWSPSKLRPPLPAWILRPGSITYSPDSVQIVHLQECVCCNKCDIHFSGCTRYSFLVS